MSATERLRPRALARRLRRRLGRKPGGVGRGTAARPPVRAPAPPPALISALQAGAPLDEPMLEEVRALIAAGKPGRVQGMAEALRSDDETNDVARLLAGVVAYQRGFIPLAWAELHGLPSTVWARFAAAEFLRAGLAMAPAEALTGARRLLADDPPEVRAESWYEVVAALFGYGAHDLAREAFAIFERHVEEDAPGWPDGPLHRDWLAPWIAADAGSPSAPAPPGGRPVVAIMDYGHPGARRASANIGDHIQSIAGMAHIVRHRGVRLHGRPELVDMLETLRRRTRPEFARDDVEADLEVMTVHRDASMYQAIPEGTWALCFGWYMHALFTMRHGFPLHRNLRPIFISFHCNKRDLLTPDAVAYLTRHGPVGCRDWTTVHLLASQGIPAFFSGCLTTTIGAVFPPGEAPPPEAPVAYVDVPEAEIPVGGTAYKHSSPAVRPRPFLGNVKLALDRLDTYRGEHPRVITSRLHCHLPLRSIGTETEFRPANPADVRYTGLIGIGDEAFARMRSGIDDKIEHVLRKILTRASEDEVYATWREITAEDVAAAETERRRPLELPGAKADREAGLGRARAAIVTYAGRTAAASDGTVHCAVLADKRSDRALGALLDSLVAHATGSLHVWVLSPVDRVPPLARRFPEMTLSWIPTKPLGARGRRLRRVLLPELLPEVDRLVLLPLPAVVTADIAELAGLDLGPHPIAAAARHKTTAISGFGVINTAANRLRDQPAAAAELRRTALARHRFDFDAFATNVMVLDLERLRAERFTPKAMELALAFELNDVEVLHLMAGPDRATVPARWAVVPTRTPERGPGLRHWADGVKPWQQVLTPERELWRRHAIAP